VKSKRHIISHALLSVT